MIDQSQTQQERRSRAGAEKMEEKEIAGAMKSYIILGFVIIIILGFALVGLYHFMVDQTKP
jgi:hypothetical protein